VVTKPVSPETFETPKLPSGLVFADLYRRDGLVKIDASFMDELGRQAPELHARVLQARQAPTADLTGQSDLIIAVAPYFEDFVGQLFGIERELRALQVRHSELAPLYV